MLHVNYHSFLNKSLGADTLIPKNIHAFKNVKATQTCWDISSLRLLAHPNILVELFIKKSEHLHYNGELCIVLFFSSLNLAYTQVKREGEPHASVKCKITTLY